MLTLFIYFCLALVACAKVLPEDQVGAYLSDPKSLVAFYHMRAGPEDKRNIARDQTRAVNESGLLDLLDNVFYITAGTGTEDVEVSSSDKYIHLADHGEKGTELQTLSLLHKFCKANPSSKVLYFHDMTSGNYPQLNSTGNSSDHAKLADYLTLFVLKPDCIKSLDSHDTCGWRISPTPQTHYSGNFWWARCEYVNTLVDPLTPVNNEKFVDVAKDLNGCLATDPAGFASTWIGTGPILLPADCMSAQADHSYIWGAVASLLPVEAQSATAKPTNHTCKTASTFEHVHHFKKAIDNMNALLPAQCRDNRAQVSRLSEILYGEAPHTYLEWMDRLDSSQLVDDGTLVRFSDSPEIYLAKDNELRGVPDLKTFIKMGRDLSEVRSKLAKDRVKYTFGSMLPYM